MLKRHNPCPGFINGKKCPYNCYDKNTCRIHITTSEYNFNIIQNIPEKEKRIKNMCCLCNTVLFYVPISVANSKFNALCRECAIKVVDYNTKQNSKNTMEEID